MQPIARWLVARPQNAILGLAVTLVLPLAPLLSGACMAFLVLHQGPVRSAVGAAIALAVLSAVAFVIDGTATGIIVSGLRIWIPVTLLAILLRRMQSVTLLLQISVFVAVFAILAMFVVLGDPVTYWKQVLTDMAPFFAKLGMQQQADTLIARRDEIAPQMTVIVIFTIWSIYAGVLLIGYALLGSLPGQDSAFGRFADLDFGRVLAIMMAVASIAAWLSGFAWIQNTAFLLFLVFWLQGLALVHWLHAAGRLPTIGLVVVYVAIPIVNVLLISGLAVAGYADAWFGYRKRIAPKR